MFLFFQKENKPLPILDVTVKLTCYDTNSKFLAAVNVFLFNTFNLLLFTKVKYSVVDFQK